MFFDNNTKERLHTTYSWIYWDDLFSADELEILRSQVSSELYPATIMGSSDREEVEKVRISDIKFYTRDDITSWVFDKFNYIISLINERYYGFNLNGYDVFQYTQYDSHNSGKYDWHMDTILGNNLQNADRNQTRKLTVVMLLSEPEKDFTGGELCFPELGLQFKPEPNDMLVFRTTYDHYNKSVLSGVKYSYMDHIMLAPESFIP